MPTYRCPKCEKEFLQKCDYIRHISRKYPCKLECNKNVNLKEYTCFQCNK